MNYIGSKLSLLEFLEESINKIVDKDCSTFCDLFAGTGIVGRYFKKKGYTITSNDIQYYSYVLNRHYIGNHKELGFIELLEELPELSNIKIEDRMIYVCNYLTELDGVEGFIYRNYCIGGSEYRQYFSDSNGKRCDSIRETIERWKGLELISEDEYYFLIASLIESIDKTANTASVYGAYLKKLKRSAQKDLVMVPAELIINNKEHKVFNSDINRIIKEIEGDILYLDPPYNQRQYATNYHILETIAKGDTPLITGKTGLRGYSDQKSLYCSRAHAREAFTDLIKNARARYIFLSYNNEGLLTLDDIKEIMATRGEYGYFTRSYNRFKADRDINRKYLASKTMEYLHYVIIKQ